MPHVLLETPIPSELDHPSLPKNHPHIPEEDTPSNTQLIFQEKLQKALCQSLVASQVHHRLHLDQSQSPQGCIPPPEFDNPHEHLAQQGWKRFAERHFEDELFHILKKYKTTSHLPLKGIHIPAIQSDNPYLQDASSSDENPSPLQSDDEEPSNSPHSPLSPSSLPSSLQQQIKNHYSLSTDDDMGNPLQLQSLTHKNHAKLTLYRDSLLEHLKNTFNSSTLPTEAQPLDVDAQEDSLSNAYPHPYAYDLDIGYVCHNAFSFTHTAQEVRQKIQRILQKEELSHISTKTHPFYRPTQHHPLLSSLHTFTNTSGFLYNLHSATTPWRLGSIKSLLSLPLFLSSSPTIGKTPNSSSIPSPLPSSLLSSHNVPNFFCSIKTIHTTSKKQCLVLDNTNKYISLDEIHVLLKEFSRTSSTTQNNTSHHPYLPFDINNTSTNHALRFKQAVFSLGNGCLLFSKNCSELVVALLSLDLLRQGIYQSTLDLLPILSIPLNEMHQVASHVGGFTEMTLQYFSPFSPVELSAEILNVYNQTSESFFRLVIFDLHDSQEILVPTDFDLFSKDSSWKGKFERSPPLPVPTAPLPSLEDIEEKKAEERRVEEKKAEERRAEEKRAEEKRAEERKAEEKRAEERKAEERGEEREEKKEENSGSPKKRKLEEGRRSSPLKKKVRPVRPFSQEEILSQPSTIPNTNVTVRTADGLKSTNVSNATVNAAAKIALLSRNLSLSSTSPLSHTSSPPLPDSPSPSPNTRIHPGCLIDQSLYLNKSYGSLLLQNPFTSPWDMTRLESYVIPRVKLQKKPSLFRTLLSLSPSLPPSSPIKRERLAEPFTRSPKKSPSHSPPHPPSSLPVPEEKKELPLPQNPQEASTNPPREDLDITNPCYPFWKRNEHSIDNCLSTLLFWSFIHQSTPTQLQRRLVFPVFNPLTTSVPVLDTSSQEYSSLQRIAEQCINPLPSHPQTTLNSLSSSSSPAPLPIKQETPPKNRNLSRPYDIIKSSLHNACEIPFLFKPQDFTSHAWITIGTLNNPLLPPSEEHSVAETGILLYSNGVLINRLDVPFPCSEKDSELFMPHKTPLSLPSLHPRGLALPLTVLVGVPKEWTVSSSGTRFDAEDTILWQTLRKRVCEVMLGYLEAVEKSGLKEFIAARKREMYDWLKGLDEEKRSMVLLCYGERGMKSVSIVNGHKPMLIHPRRERGVVPGGIMDLGVPAPMVIAGPSIFDTDRNGEGELEAGVDGEGEIDTDEMDIGEELVYEGEVEGGEFVDEVEEDGEEMEGEMDEEEMEMEDEELLGEGEEML